jgi:hypothetical protein
MSKKRKNSRAKGARGEVAFAKELGYYNINAVRGQQKYGGMLSPDVIHNLPGVHFEVKCNEKMKVGSKLLDDALEQALNDTTGDIFPVVVWRRNRERWKATFLFQVYPPNLEGTEVPVTMDFEDFMYARGHIRGDKSVYVSPKDSDQPWINQTTPTAPFNQTTTDG